MTAADDSDWLGAAGAPAPEMDESDAAMPWEPYPLAVLPLTLCALAREGAAAIGCDASMIAVPALVACAGAIGMARSALIKPGWSEPCVLWAAIVARSGSGKDPALDVAAEPLRELDEDARRADARAAAEYRAAVARHAMEMRQWQRKGEGDQPIEPEPPRRTRLLIADATYEAATALVAEVPRQSLVVVRGEISAWIREWGEYIAARSSHAAKWLELHGARLPATDRITRGAVYAAHACISVVGAIQPGTLARVLDIEHIDSGCAARVLWAVPPPTAAEWSDRSVSDSTRERYRNIIQALRAIEPRQHTHADGATTLAPHPLTLTIEARRVYREWHDEVAETCRADDDDVAAAASKLAGGAARVGLVIALVRAAELGEVGALDEIDGEAMTAAISIARWHLREARRVLRLLGRRDGDDRLLDLLTAAGPVGLSPRDLTRRSRAHRPVATAEAALEELVKKRHAEWRETRRGARGPAARRAVLVPKVAPSTGSSSTGFGGSDPGKPVDSEAPNGNASTDDGAPEPSNGACSTAASNAASTGSRASTGFDSGKPVDEKRVDTGPLDAGTSTGAAPGSDTADSWAAWVDAQEGTL